LGSYIQRSRIGLSAHLLRFTDLPISGGGHEGWLRVPGIVQ
jgi:hypothetical protein